MCCPIRLLAILKQAMLKLDCINEYTGDTFNLFVPLFAGICFEWMGEGAGAYKFSFVLFFKSLGTLQISGAENNCVIDIV